MAGQQPPTRSWFRLASIARMEAAEAAAAASSSLPPPRTPVLRLQPPTPPLPLPEPQPDLPSALSAQPTQSVAAPQPPPDAPPPLPTTPESPKLTVKQPLSAPIPLPQPETKQPLSSPIPLPEPETKPPLSAPILLPHPETKQPLFSPIPLPEPETKLPLSAPILLPHPETKQPLFSPIPLPQPEMKPPLSAPIPLPQPEMKPPLSAPIPLPQPETKPLMPPEEKPMNNVVSYNNKVMRNLPSPRLLTEAKEDRKMRVITMAGENTGAVMDFGGGGASASPFHHACHRILHAGIKAHEGKQNHLDVGEKWSPSAASKRMEAVVNSNVQGVNNSLVFNSSCTQHSAGVHITFASSRRPKEGCAADNAHESCPRR